MNRNLYSSGKPKNDIVPAIGSRWRLRTNKVATPLIHKVINIDFRGRIDLSSEVDFKVPPITIDDAYEFRKLFEPI